MLQPIPSGYSTHAPKIVFLLKEGYKPPQIAKILKISRMSLFRYISVLSDENKVKIVHVNKRIIRYLIPDVTTNTDSIRNVTTPLVFRFENVRVKYPLLSIGTFTGKRVVNLRYDRYIEKYGNEILIEINAGKSDTSRSVVVVFRQGECKENPTEARQEFLTRATQALTDWASKYNLIFAPNPKFSGKIVQSEAAINTPSAPEICEKVGFFKNEYGQFDKSNKFGEQEYNPDKATGFDAFDLADKHLKMPLNLEKIVDAQEKITKTQESFDKNIVKHLNVLEKMEQRLGELGIAIRTFKPHKKKKNWRY